MKRVAILCGGPGSEHEISCLSAGGVLSAINRVDYEPVLIGITREGKWISLPLDYPLSLQDGTLPSVSGDFSEVIRSHDGFVVDGANLVIDVIFPVLHGTYGEDGQLQSDLDQLGIPYVGSGAVASELAMDKSDAKIFFAKAGLDVAPSITVTESQWQSDPAAVAQSIEPLGLPLFVKASRGGSSRGTVKVKALESFNSAMEEARSPMTRRFLLKALSMAQKLNAQCWKLMAKRKHLFREKSGLTPTMSFMIFKQNISTVQRALISQLHSPLKFLRVFRALHSTHSRLLEQKV
jgi:D-alanine-D-alanine ligase